MMSGDKRCPAMLEKQRIGAVARSGHPAHSSPDPVEIERIRIEFEPQMNADSRRFNKMGINPICVHPRASAVKIESATVREKALDQATSIISVWLAVISGLFFTCPVGTSSTSSPQASSSPLRGESPSTRCRATSSYAGKAEDSGGCTVKTMVLCARSIRFYNRLLACSNF